MTDALPAFEVYADHDALAEALAARVAAAVGDRICHHGKATLALSGGRTPARFMEMLSDERIPWSDVTVTLVDERWVDETSPRSNAALVRQHLLRRRAAAATLVPLHRPTATPDESLPAVEAAIAALPRPFAAVVLGMGDDGHTASFFPGGDRLAAAIDPAGTALVTGMQAAGAGEPRVTLTLPPILAADFVALHIEGKAKRAVYERAVAGSDALELPVRSVLKAGRPVSVFWCA